MSQHTAKAAQAGVRRAVSRHHHAETRTRIMLVALVISLGAAMMSGPATASAADSTGASDRGSRSGTHAPLRGSDGPDGAVPAVGEARALAAALADAHCMAIGCTEWGWMPELDAPLQDVDAPPPDPDVLLPDTNVHEVVYVCMAIGCPRLPDVLWPDPDIPLRDPAVPLPDPGCGSASAGDGQQAQDNCDYASVHEGG